MDIQLHEVVNWVVVGVIAGQLVGFLVTGKREGMGWYKNLLAGLTGGVVGGFLFTKLIDLDFGMSEYKITLQQIVAAILGTLLVLLALKLLRSRKSDPTT
jgi:uncharacterized membrane protein YeaQ/YmgE (transglycosylase-associated protein family)